MKALVITGSRADRNGLEVVHEALLKAGHESVLCADFGRAWFNDSDVAILGGDRSEILRAAVELSIARMPIAHIAGGDVTTGSADDRYRDAITALSCIHFATNEQAMIRLSGTKASCASGMGGIVEQTDTVYWTGSPAIDRIKQTSILSREELFKCALGGDEPKMKHVLVCVHPNTVGNDPFADYNAVMQFMNSSADQYGFVCLGSNNDPGGHIINHGLSDFAKVTGDAEFFGNVSPQFYYSLMTHCDVMVGNSSAMLYEAPSFGLPCVLVGDRQSGRTIPKNVMCAPTNADKVAVAVGHCLDLGRLRTTENPYGDGNSAPRIVKALEENEWRWKRA